MYEYFFKAVVRDSIWKQCFAENKSWVPMLPKPLLRQSLKTSTWHGCMITKTKTQDAPY
jgi:hypothetical protein